MHLITLHTVPAYNFGNKASPNYQRNADQLRFLEWYLTGKTDFEVNLPEKFSHIKPLPKGSSFIAMGDWNTEIDNRVNPGSRVLRRLAQNGRFYPSPGDIKSNKEGHITNEAPNYNPNRLTLVLDYMMWSQDLRPINLKVMRPKEERLFLGCGAPSFESKESSSRSLVKFKKFNDTCYKTINKSFLTAKKASDHFPLFGSFRFR